MEAREATATGESCMRVDAIAKVTGRARYTDDYVMAGMCYAKYVRSPIAHGYAVSNKEMAAFRRQNRTDKIPSLFLFQDLCRSSL